MVNGSDGQAGFVNQCQGWAVVGVFSLVMLITGCDSGGSSGDPETDAGNDDAQSDQLRIVASVVDDQGFALSGATVSFESATGGAYLITDSKGETEYRSSVRQDLTVGASADGHLEQVRPLIVPEDASRMRLRFVLKTLSEGETQADVESGFTYTSDDGTGIEISAGTLKVVRGAPAVGDVNLQLSSLQFDDPLSRQAFPGAFEGENDQFESTLIAALAAGSFRFSQADDPLELTFGQTATVILPLSVTKNSDDQALAVGQMVPLWSLNESTGLWEQEGDGMVVDWAAAPTGLGVQGTVSHFSWWMAGEPLPSVPLSVSLNCPQSDTDCQGLNVGGQIEFEAADDDGPWFAQSVFLPRLNAEMQTPTELPALPLWVYGSDAYGGYAGTNPEAIGAGGGTYPPQIPLNPSVDEQVSINLQPSHEVLPDWPGARDRAPLIGLLSSLNETHAYDLALRPNDELELQVTRIDRFDFDSDMSGAGAGVAVSLEDPNGIVLFSETLDSGGPLSVTVPVDTGGDHRLSLVGISNEKGGYAASTSVKPGPRPIVAQCEPYDPEPDSISSGGQWSGQGDARETTYSIPASQRGGGIITATLTAGHPDIDPRLQVCADNACTGGSIAGDTGITDPAAQVKFEAKVDADYTFHIEQFGNAPVDEYPQAYSLNVDFSPRVDCWEPNNTIAEARGIRLDEPIEAYMLAGFESSSVPSAEFVDWYAIDVRHAGKLQADINPPAGNHLMRIRLEDDEGNAVSMANQQGLAGEAFTVESASSVAPGIYYMRVGVLVGDDRKVEGGNDPSPEHWNQQYTMTVTRQ